MCSVQQQYFINTYQHKILQSDVGMGKLMEGKTILEEHKLIHTNN